MRRTKMLTIGFIGAGNMGQAMMQGWAPNKEIKQLVYSTTMEKSEAVAAKIGGEARGSIMELWAESDMVVVAVPPTALADIAPEIKQWAMLKPSVILTSVVGGVDLAALHAHFGEQLMIVRALPNINVALRYGYTALAFDGTVDADTRGALAMLFLDFGRADEYPEDQFGAVSALAGSGPAFVAGFTEAMMKAGLAAGIDAEKAESLAIQTVAGTGKNMIDLKKAPKDLANEVMTPGGSTAAGYDVLMTQLDGLVRETIDATMIKNAEASEN
ncbi:NAD(P)-binding domain-containing protein [Weissella ceti]|uniref:Pyrroline-5-carboxylate reductase n=1 Tax=Weissella ceti TaxID=759620 RepID=A0ABT3E585_9LACO|nr:pyrroline-5-carboxylate reductase dimerization domain-containing protein [Weissella ceti]MCW0953576.1 NAD(P)-binding domain-containing protein [Weissella ceti]